MSKLRTNFMGAGPTEFVANRVSFGPNGEQTGITPIDGMGGNELTNAGQNAEFNNDATFDLG